MKHFLSTSMKVFLVGLFLAATSILHAQDTGYNDRGIYKGVVKVKFAPSEMKKLSSMKVNTRSNKLATGITSFDNTAKTMGASNMERLFPYDPKIEHKLVKHGLHLWYIVHINENLDPEAAALQFLELPEVVSVDCERKAMLQPYQQLPYTPNIIKPQSTMPFNDPQLPDQWHYDNRGQTGHAGADINLFKAWEKTAGRGDVIVAIMDQGVDAIHEDLFANMWVNEAELNGTPGEDDDGNGYIDDIYGFNFVSNKGAVDPEFHGTHVAGTVAAVNNNGIGVSGVAGGTGKGDGAKIMSCQIIGAQYVERAFVYAATNGAVISQNSWGYPNHNPNFPNQMPALLAAIDYFIDEAGDYPGSPMKGGIVIFAAGNNGEGGRESQGREGLYWPGCYERVLSVTALGPTWEKAKYSNYDTWTEVAAPGGDDNPEKGFTTRDLVLSTSPFNQYAYSAGTSMACPHVSGIAALALASSKTQMTNRELWNRLITGVVDIDSYNPAYIGKLGTGAIDAASVIADNAGIAPEKITDLQVEGATQEFAILKWTVPADNDDGQPMSYDIYYHTEPITAENLVHAAKKELNRTSKLAGESITFEIDGLYGFTDYYFAVISFDRWSNKSELSNVTHVRTDKGPDIDVNTGEPGNTVTININAAVSTTGSKTFNIINNGDGLLRWNHFFRTKTYTYATMSAISPLPVVAPKKLEDMKIGGTETSNAEVFNSGSLMLKNDEGLDMFTQIVKTYAKNITRYIGDEDVSLPTSAAVKFFVEEEKGFNLTDFWFYLTYTAGTGNIRVEIYKGDEPTAANLIHSQEQIVPGNQNQKLVSVQMTEQIFFEQGSQFWIVIHVPEGNQYPLGTGAEISEEHSNYCYYSNDYGQNWTYLATVTALPTTVWGVFAVSNNADLGEYITLSPAKDEVFANSSQSVTVSANAAKLINGKYNTSLVLTSNDINKKELRVPIIINVEGQKPKLVYPDVVDYGSVFVGESRTYLILIENLGYGMEKNLVTTIEGPNASQFQLRAWPLPPSKYEARSLDGIEVTFKPTTIGNINAKLKITNGTNTYYISTFGVGAATSEIAVAPASQTISGITIDDNVQANITVKNNGGYPLKYFVPKFDDKGISNNWPKKFHEYGYAERSSVDLINPVPFAFQDITTTGVNVTEPFLSGELWVTVPIGFDFPYYGKIQDSIHIVQLGFTVFEKNVHPINTPDISGTGERPHGYISPIGHAMKFDAPGSGIFYKAESDKFIVQFNGSQYSGDPIDIKAQMVLHANGDIRFYYDKVWNSSMIRYLNILIESAEQTDAILLNNYDRLDYSIVDGFAFGLDYPGPDIVTSITNASGILSPGEMALLTVNMKTDDLPEGLHKKYINIISNDPLTPRENSLIELDIVAGGAFSVKESTDELDFGTVYLGHTYTKSFGIKNDGTRLADITSITVTPADFTVTPAAPYTIKPGINQLFEVTPNTAIVGDLASTITITFLGGHTIAINAKATVADAPVIVADNTLLSETLTMGTTTSHPYTITNTGAGSLEYSVSGGQWFRFEDTNAAISEYDYTVYTHNKGEPTYDWIDLLETGNHMKYDGETPSTKEEYWRVTLTDLPFPVTFYGQTYNKIRVADNGIVSFGEYLPNIYHFPPDNMPLDDDQLACIMPLLMPLYYRPDFPEDIIGLFYQYFTDKIVITWEYVGNYTGMGNPMSVQLIIYDNGNFKMQYNVRGNPGEPADRWEASSRAANVAMQAPGKKLKLISHQSGFTHNNGLAFLAVPADKKVLTPGQSTSGNIVFDATNVYSGTFNQDLIIRSNDPATPAIEKPLQLTVPGSPAWNIPDSPNVIDLGSFEVLIDKDGAYTTYYTSYGIKNTGTTPISITRGTISPLNEVDMQFFYKSTNSSAWTPIFRLWGFMPNNPNPTFVILPGETLLTRISFRPTSSGDKQTTVSFTTTEMGLKTFILKAKGYFAPEINVDETPIVITMNTHNEVEQRTISVGNNSVEFDLTYETTVEYLRNIAAPSSTRISSNTNADIPLASVSNKAEVMAVKNGMAIQSTNAFTQVLRYYEDSDKIYGWAPIDGGKTRQKFAVKFKAGPEGANISDVGTMFKRESVFNGYVTAEVKIGNTRDPENALLAASGRYTFKETTPGGSGELVNIELDKEVQLYPNEEFYVVFSYPLTIINPQAVMLNNMNLNTLGRFLVFAPVETTNERGEDVIIYMWVDAQQYYGMGSAGGGFIAYAAEQTPDASGWLKIIDNASGIIPISSSLDVKLEASGENAHQGTQKANIVFTSNDTNNPTVKVPVSLIMNEAPKFIDAPNQISMSEDEILTVVMNVVDNEGHEFVASQVEIPSIATCNISGGVVTLTFTTTYGDAGSYVVKLRAEDSYGASTDLELPVTVTRKNRVPQSLNDALYWVYNLHDEAKIYYFADLFSDPDEDKLTGSVVAQEGGIVEVYQMGAATSFAVKPLAVGTTTLTIKATDESGAIATTLATVEVTSCEEGVIVQKWNSTLLINNKSNLYKNDGYQWYKNGEAIAGATKQYYTAEALDFTAQYHVKMVKNDGTVVYACPFTPQQKDVSLMVYPNPVERGQAVTINTQLPSIDTNPVTIQVINLRGLVMGTLTTKESVNTMQMPTEEGIYFITISDGNAKETFKVIVK